MCSWLRYNNNNLELHTPLLPKERGKNKKQNKNKDLSHMSKIKPKPLVNLS